ncbi:MULTISPECIES: oligopeptide/dipeptide ABC transporter ATP-binding protein [Paraburkholderia]|uniref:oligopeptide/dipeptide ABC transporter ATP-binding protein n=1 Tax=Paraburkholderia TaxID=1822464 RepID=UPI001EF890FE|nr:MULTISPECIES: oligopeptide/dipeptide ABC transporter ATP-binding protein [Paraburkholderia]
MDLEVQQGELHGIVGESGCGKTSLSRTIAGLQRPTGGRVLIDGRELEEWRRDRLAFSRHVQFIFQDPLASLSSRQTIFESLEEPLKVHGLGTASGRRARVVELLQLVSLPETCLDRLPRALSGGQRQRVAIARALALDPRVLICDEPLSALDVSIRAQILNLFADLQKKLDLTIVLIAHDLAIVRLVCTRVSVMYLGKIVETGPTSEIFARPRHPYTRALLDAAPSTDPEIERVRHVSLLDGDPPSPSSPPSGCRFHTRCPLSKPICETREPELKLLGTRSRVACHLV